MTTSDINLVIRGRDMASQTLNRVNQSLGSVASRLTGVLAGLTAGFTAYFSVRGFLTAANDIDALAKAADRLDMSTQSLQAFDLQARLTGTSTEAARRAVSEMVRVIGEAQRGSTRQTDLLQSLGLDPASLARLTSDQAFRQVADAINRIEDRYQRAAVQQQIFGRGAREVDGLIRAGGDGLDAAADKIERIGGSLSRVDAARVEQANDAMTLLGEAARATGQRIAVELSPVIAGVADKIVEGIDYLGGIDRIIKDIMDVVIPVANFLDKWIWQPLQMGTDLVFAIQSRIAQGIATVVDLAGRGITSVLNLIPGVNITFTSMFRDIAEEAGYMAQAFEQSLSERFDGWMNSPNRVSTWIAKQRADGIAAAEAVAQAVQDAVDPDELQTGQSAIERLIDRLVMQADTFGMARREAELYQAALEGATEAQIRQAQALIEQLDAMEAQQELARQGQRVFEQTRSDAEKRAAEIERLERLLAAGAIDQDTFSRALDQLQQTIATRQLSTGSAGGIAAIEARFLQRAPGQDVALRTERHTAKTAQEVTAMRQLVGRVGQAVQDIARNMSRGPTVQIEGF